MDFDTIKIILIVIGIIVYFFLMSYAHKKQNENDVDDYFDDSNHYF